MKGSVGVIYAFLISIFVFSSGVLFLIVSSELQKIQVVKNDTSHVIFDNSEAPIDFVDNSTFSSDLPSQSIESVVKEIKSSFDESSYVPLRSTIEAGSADLTQQTGFTYASIQDKLGDAEEGVVVTLMEPKPPPQQEIPTSNGTVTDAKPSLKNFSGENASHDDIPSFSEWAQKQIAEAEKKIENTTTNSGGSVKVRSKNYASPDCGAKVLSSNPEAQSPGSILSSSRDEYILSPCNARTWFIVELCESIQPQKIEVANFELFSSSPKDFTVFISDRYPTRDWTHALTTTAKDERTVQSFSLPHLPQFAKFIKVEIHSHYGTEHYCPISLFRAYGTSELEVLETVEEASGSGGEEEDDGIHEEVGEAGPPQNLFGSARDAVLSIVKKAAEVLVVKTQRNTTCNEPNSTTLQTTANCLTPGYLLVCHNCSDNFFYRVYHLLCCHQPSLQSLLSSPFVSKTLLETRICTGIGLEWPQMKLQEPKKPKTSANTYKKSAAYLTALLPMEKIAALCNMLAVSYKKVVLNVSHDANKLGPGKQLKEELIPKEKTLEVPMKLPETTKTEEAASSESSTMLPSSVASQASSPSLELDTPSLSLSLPTETQDPSTQQISPTKTLSSPPEEKLAPSNAQGNTSSLHVQGNASVPDSGLIDNDTLSDTPPLEDKPSQIEEMVNLTGETAPSIIPVENMADESVDTLTLDTLLSDLEEETVTESASKVTTIPPQPIQKESVFVRLANRIKALERNMSLSSQYLEELSRRYKKQVEELQRTLAGVMEERRVSSERETLQAAQISILTHRVDTLTSAISELIMERETWTNKASIIGQHGIIIVVEVVVFVIVLTICKWLSGAQMNEKMSNMSLKPEPEPTQRRKSLNDLNKEETKVLKRRPSEEAVLVAGQGHCDLLIDEETRKMPGGKKRKRRRKGGLEIVRPFVDPPAIQQQPPPPTPPPQPPPAPPPPAPTPSAVATIGPPPSHSFIKTALWSRKHRLSFSQQTQNGSQDIPPSKPKKPGPLKKIVKKLF